MRGESITDLHMGTRDVFGVAAALVRIAVEMVRVRRHGRLAHHNDVGRRFAHLAVVTLVHVAVWQVARVQGHVVFDAAQGCGDIHHAVG